MKSAPNAWRKALSWAAAILLALACVVVAWVLLGAVFWFAKWLAIGVIACVLFEWVRRRIASKGDGTS